MPLKRFVISMVFISSFFISNLCSFGFDFQLGFLVPAHPQQELVCHRQTTNRSLVIGQSIRHNSSEKKKC